MMLGPGDRVQIRATKKTGMISKILGLGWMKVEIDDSDEVVRVCLGEVDEYVPISDCSRFPGLSEHDLITYLEIARVATQCCRKELSSQMNFSLEFFRKANKHLTELLAPVYGENSAKVEVQSSDNVVPTA